MPLDVSPINAISVEIWIQMLKKWSNCIGLLLMHINATENHFQVLYLQEIKEKNKLTYWNQISEKPSYFIFSKYWFFTTIWKIVIFSAEMRHYTKIFKCC